MNPFANFEELTEELIPDIPNDLITQVVTPKLKWADLRILSSVSRSWIQAFQTHQIFDARVRSHSTETFLVLNRSSLPADEKALPWDPIINLRSHAISLYSIREKLSYDLPPIAQLGRGIPLSCQWVALNGRLYVLGGAEDPQFHIGSRRVYMLDVAGRANHWERCSDMSQGRLSFAAAVKDGKIYVFGGISSLMPVLECEVYDPEVNSWTAIKPMISLRFCHQVAIVGQEFVLHGGYCFESGWNTAEALEECALARECTEDTCLCHLRHGYHAPGYINPAMIPEVYHPAKDEWRYESHSRVNSCRARDCWHPLFSAQGKLNSIASPGIFAYDMDKQSDVSVHSFAHPTRRYTPFPDIPIESPYSRISMSIAPGYSMELEARSVLAVGNQLLVIAIWSGCGGSEDSEPDKGTCLLQGTGFGCANGNIKWELLY